jgi:hypothetical protein
MRMTQNKQPPTRSLRGWAIATLHEAHAIRSAKSTVGCGNAPIRTRASRPSCWLSESCAAY